MENSDVTVTGPLSAQRVAYNPHWARTLGFWNLTDRTTFAREFLRKRAAVQVFFFYLMVFFFRCFCIRCRYPSSAFCVSVCTFVLVKQVN
jgi:hypothetical protein